MKQLSQNAIVVILIFFILGIILSSLFTVYWGLIAIVWLSAIMVVGILEIYGHRHIKFRKIIFMNIIFLTLVSGMLSYTLHAPESLRNDFSFSYLEGDYLLGQIKDYQQGKNDYDKTIVAIQSIVARNGQKKEAQGNLLCYFKRDSVSIKENQIVLFQPIINKIRNTNNPGEFDAEKFWKSKNVFYISFVPSSTVQIIDSVKTFRGFWNTSRERLIAIIKKHVSTENQGTVIALTLGDKSSLSTENINHFTNAGAMHVLAVSGMHVGILLTVIQFIFNLFPILRKRNMYLYFGILTMWIFAFITGLSGSVTRAVTMFTIMAIGQIMGRKFFSLHGIFTSALLLLIFNPLFLFDIGFQLSYLAVIGIGLFYRPLLKLLTVKTWGIKQLWEGTVLGVAAQIGTLPISLYYFHQFPNYFFITNLGMIVLAFAAMASVVLLLTVFWIPIISKIVSVAVDFIFQTLLQFVAWIDALPVSVSRGYTPNGWFVFLIFIGISLIAYFWHKQSYRKLILSAFSLFLFSIGLIYDREENLMKRELVVFNYYKPIVAIKENRRLFVVYDAKRVKEESELDFILRGYENATGIPGIRIPLKQESQLSLLENVEFEYLKAGITIHYYNQKFLLANQLSSQINSEFKTVIGNWNTTLEQEKALFTTKESALVIKNK